MFTMTRSVCCVSLFLKYRKDTKYCARKQGHNTAHLPPQTMGTTLNKINTESTTKQQQQQNNNRTTALDQAATTNAGGLY